MMGKEDGSGNPRAPCQLSGSRKMFWRSASWSSSMTGLQNPETEEKDCVDPSGNFSNSNGQNRRYPAPLTPRSSKARACLPPLQPLAIARRSLDEWPKAGSDDLGEWPQPPTPSGKQSGERLKLDLSSIQRNPDRNGGGVKREKIAFFDKECSKVAEHVYLGGDAVAKDREILKQNGITHVLNCVGFVCPEYFKADLVYRTLWLQDSPSEDITSILYDVFDYFEDVREQGGRVFVHCCQGVSRSTSLVIAYLMWREGQSFDDAFHYVKAARGIADPNMGFACQLLQCQKRVHAIPLSPSSLLRMYRIAPHSPYDPLHLVPKMLNDPSPSALDSRGAFIVHIPSAIYIWVGKHCNAIMERDARAAVCQIMRYERAQGPIKMVKEGEEPSSFWDAFSNYLPIMDKSGNGMDLGHSTCKVSSGERKLGLYDVEYEFFQKAVMGGFVPPFTSSEDEHEIHLPVRESSWSMLRRKFNSCDMKEFVSGPKIFSRVYSDSMMIVHSSSPSSTVSLSSSSPSPPYLSPDSFSSDSSNSSKYLSGTSLDSSTTASCPLPVSSTLSKFSDLSVNLSITSQSLSNSPEPPGVCDTSPPCSQSASLPFKKSSPSLAERRDGFKSLKLAATDAAPSFLVSQQHVLGMNNEFLPSCELDDVEIVLESKDSIRSGVGDSTKDRNLKKSLCNVVNSNSVQKKVASNSNCELLKSNDWRGPPASSVFDENASVSCNSMKPLVCRWPSLERIEKFGKRDLDSKSAFVILAPNANLGKNEDRTLYFWVGRSFCRGKTCILLGSSKLFANLGEVDWIQVGGDVLTQMGWPRDTSIKVVEEDKEPVEFLALIGLLQHQFD
ncbi:Mitogen-activated protein kinase phosphatase 1 [Tripterygium wilfordii]|uniref:Mitogen-activated protein kinase phosphatase 1 n=1 Tax=Tripterygium wilfordii TaxID=458696 RepID=A0A7J7D8N5_TRIWF|nr:protein-tyrosine-phosphatase MKP1 [Tripterygium wilfordii]KAF5742648.1 Mitogen-activated protein kinase phosphatase 1 [Tripterygium wilfordii]